LTYTYLGARTDANTRQPVGGALFATLTHPVGVEQVALATGSAHLAYNVYDLEVARRFVHDDALVLRVFAGPRFVNFNTDVRAVYQGGDAGAGDLVRARVAFDGGGARFGAEASGTSRTGWGCTLAAPPRWSPARSGRSSRRRSTGAR